MNTEPDAPQGGAEAVVPSQVDAPIQENAEDTAAQPVGAEQPVQADETGDAPKRKPWWEKRFDELTAKRYDAERDAAYWRGVAESPGQQQPQQPTRAGPPTLDEFNWDENAFQSANAAYYREEAEKAAERVIEARTAKDRDKAHLQAVTAKLSEGAAKHTDFADVVHDIPTTPAVTDLLANDPNAADILYQVGKNPDEARRIFSLSPYLQAVELGKVAARLETPTPGSPKPIPPAPPTTVGGVSAGISKNPAEMSMGEYVAWRKQQGGLT